MKKKLLFASIGLAVLALAVIFSQNLTAAKSPASNTTIHAQEGVPMGTIVVSGEGVITADPDIAIVRLGAEMTESSADKAQSAVSEKMKAIRKALTDYGVKESDIETSQFHVNPYGHPDREQEFRAYHIISFEYKEIDKVGDLLDVASKAGANIIEPVRFSIEDPTELEHEALKLAIKQTEGKADVMAKTAGKSRGEVLQLAEQGAHINFPMSEFYAMDMAEEKSAGTVIEAGEVKVVARVNVVYRLN
ncbi:SIMPL domain-containing protein [Bacillaceae bacterium W0354]